MNAEIDNAVLMIEVTHCNSEMVKFLERCIASRALPDDNVVLEEFEKLMLLIEINDFLVKSLYEENAEIMDRVNEMVEMLESKKS